nr:hypothetical protein [Tanacetum cinerariifolium]
MFDADTLVGEGVFVARQNKNVVKEVVDVAQVSTAATSVIITTEEITLAQALKALKTLKPKVKGIVFQESGKSTTTTTISSQQSQDKGKGIMIEEPVKPKKKDQIRLDEEAAKKLQVKFNEKERLARKKAEKEQEANIALIEEWDGIQAKIDADHQLAERLQAQEQEELEDLEDLYKLVKARYGSTRPVESMDYLLWSDIKIMFEPHVENESMQINMLVEKKYPLTPSTLSMMLEKNLQIDYESEMAYQLIRLSVEDSLSAKHQRAIQDSLGVKHERTVKDSLSAKPQRATLDVFKWNTLMVLRRVRGGNTLIILLPLEKEQVELVIVSKYGLGGIIQKSKRARQNVLELKLVPKDVLIETFNGLKGDMADVDVRYNKDVNLDNQNSDIVIVNDANETVSFMALKLPKVTSYFMRKGRSGKSSIYDCWKKNYDGNPYDDNECIYLTPQQLWYKRGSGNVKEKVSSIDDGPDVGNGGEASCFVTSNVSNSPRPPEIGPWLIHNVPLILKQWTLNANIMNEDVCNIPVWVKFYDVPITAFTEDGLYAIETKLGDQLVESDEDEVEFPDDKTSRYMSSIGGGGVCEDDHDFYDR